MTEEKLNTLPLIDSVLSKISIYLQTNYFFTVPHCYWRSHQ